MITLPSIAFGWSGSSQPPGVGLVGRQFPADAATWASTFGGIATPSAIYTCQDSATPLADGIGSITLAESSTVSYANSDAAMSRSAVGIEATGAKFAAALAASHDITTGDFALGSRKDS